MDPHKSTPPSGSASPPHQAVTQLLVRAQGGDAQATDELLPIVYEELRSLAASFLRSEGRAQTIQATALVHEAYLRLVGPDLAKWDSRAHFFGAAARAIRRILVDHARERDALKRGGGMRPVSLDQVESVVIGPSSDDMVALDLALTKLGNVDPQKARITELRFFGGLTVDQTALALGISPRTVARDWQFARVWLQREIDGQPG